MRCAKIAIISGLVLVAGIVEADDQMNALIVDGRNNHNWRGTTPWMKKILEEDGLFEVDVATGPLRGQQSLEGFKPDFDRYDVVVMNYNDNESWPEDTKTAFENYVENGGGLVIVHAADNAFPKWQAYNEMIAVGGWGGRNEKSGPMIRYRDGKMVLDKSPGRGGTHGPQRPFQVVVRDTQHPITKGLPTKWMHAKDELYSKLRGPAKNVTLLATAESKKTGENEPVLFTIRYGKGRVFHTVLGHDVKPAMQCVGFIATLRRGSEWAATGRVNQEVPEDFPTADEVVLRN